MTVATEQWTADQWLAWLRRGPKDALPSYHGLNDCADALAAEIARLRDYKIDETEEEIEERLEHQDAAANLRLIDRIADLVGCPHDAELTVEHVIEALKGEVVA